MHIQCLLRVDGSIVAGVLNLHIPLTQQVAACWYLGTQTALVQLVAPVTSETGGCSAP